MPITLLEILDSAVKIGLGAAISGIATYKTMKLGHANERTKEIRAHRVKALEMIAEKCDDYFNAVVRFENTVVGICKGKNSVIGAELTPKQLDRIREKDALLLSSAEGVSVAATRLRLLRASEAVEILSKMIDCAADYRNKIIFDKIMPELNFSEKAGDEFHRLKVQFHEQLALLYEKI